MEAAIRSKTKNETLLLGRQITVMMKRKNLPKPKPKKNFNPIMNGATNNPLMMQACALMMAACSGGRGMSYPRGPQNYRGGMRGGHQTAFRGRGRR